MLHSESLERRQLLAAVTWDGGGDGATWTSALNWSNNRVPTAADDVTIGAFAGQVNLFDENFLEVRSLTTAATIKFNFMARLTVHEGIVLQNANILLASGQIDGLYFNGDQSISGNGMIEFQIVAGTVPQSVIGLVNPDDTVTIEAGVTVRGIGSGYLGFGGRLINRGVIEVVQANRVLSLVGDWSNEGTLRIAGGTLRFEGNYTQQQIGTVIDEAGLIVMSGNITGPLQITSNVEWQLQSATLSGVVNGPPGAALAVRSFTSTFNDVTLKTGLIVASNLDFAGELVLDDATITASAAMRSTGAGRITGAGVIQSTSTISPKFANETLEISLGVTIRALNATLGRSEAVVTNHGSIDLLNSSDRVTFSGSIQQHGTIRIAAGAIARLGTGSRLTLTPNATLESSFPAVAGTQPGRIDLTGSPTAILDGTLRVIVPPTFAASEGTSYQLLRAGTLTGGFDNYDAPSTANGLRVLATRQGLDRVNLVIGQNQPAPELLSGSFDVNDGQLLKLNFNSDISAFAEPNDFELIPLSGGSVASEVVGLAFAQNNREVSVRIGSVLPDGNYRLFATADNLRNAAGAAALNDVLFDFFILAGDANRDRAVNISDFAILAARFNLPGTFSQGDFNYDGVTNISDFSILASKFNTTLPVLSAVEGPAPSDLPKNPSARATIAPLFAGELTLADRAFTQQLSSRTASFWNDRQVMELVDEQGDILG